jgi:hypothetical protein
MNPPTAQEARRVAIKALGMYDRVSRQESDTLLAYIDHAEKRWEEIVAEIDNEDFTPIEYIRKMDEEAILHGNAIINEPVLRERLAHAEKRIEELESALQSVLDDLRLRARIADDGVPELAIGNSVLYKMTDALGISEEVKPSPDEWEYYEHPSGLQRRFKIGVGFVKLASERLWERENIDAKDVEIVRSESNGWKRVERREQP